MIGPFLEKTVRLGDNPPIRVISHYPQLPIFCRLLWKMEKGSYEMENKVAGRILTNEIF